MYEIGQVGIIPTSQMKKQTEDVSLPAFWDTAGGMLVVCVLASQTSYGSAFFIPLKKKKTIFLLI